MIKNYLLVTLRNLLRNKAFSFINIAGLALGISCSLGWYAMDWWLKSYAYHVEVGTITLIIAATLCLLVSLLTVSYHSAKAAMVNPVRSLRYE